MNIQVYDDYLTVTCADGEFTYSYGCLVDGAPPVGIMRELYAQPESTRQHLPAAVDVLLDIDALSIE